jgi:replicative DNA helicase
LPRFSPTDALKHLITRPQGFTTGFAELDRFLVIPRGALGVVAAKSRHGKTTFLMHLFWHLIRANPDQQFLFFTYEERKEWLTLKLLNRAAGTLLDPARWMQQQGLLLDYLRAGRHDIASIEAARAELQQLAETNRMTVIDEPYPAEQLGQLITRLAQNAPIGAVFVDYVQKVPVQGKARDQRYLELKTVSAELLKAAIASETAIITGCQLNRESGNGIDGIGLDHVRESADIAQDANWVLALWNEAAETETLHPDSEMQLKLLKNRDGQTGKTLSVQFHRALLTLSAPLTQF